MQSRTLIPGKVTRSIECQRRRRVVSEPGAVAMGSAASVGLLKPA